MSAETFPLNWLLTLAYDGTAYAGWQRQPNATTVQGVLLEKLAKFYDCEVPVHGTSRTDSGVHALHQHVTLHVPEIPPIPIHDVFIGLSKLLPKDIRVLALVDKPAGFHARFDSVGKAYTYLIYRGRTRNPFMGRYFWELRFDLDLDAMRQAADQLLGTHDFTGFSANPRTPNQPSPVKTLHRIEMRELGDILMVTVVGKSFLYKMVRRIIGYLVNVGRGRLAAAETAGILASRQRHLHIETAMAHGLYLDRVFFAEADMHAYHRETLPFLELL